MKKLSISICLTIFGMTCMSQSLIETGSVNTTENSSQALSLSVLRVNAFPNPSSSYFSLRVQTHKKDEIYVNVLESTGVSVRQLVMLPGTVLTFGHELKAGNYIVEVVQRNVRKTLYLVKN